MLNQRESSFAQTTIDLVLRYGMARTTMGDVAKEAGVSRQTLYSVFPNKESLLRATIRYLAERGAAAIIKECAPSKSLDEKLDIVVRHTALNSFELLRSSPDADDIVSGFNSACKEEIEEASQGFQTIIEGLLTPYAQAIEDKGMSVVQLANYIQKNTLMLKHEAKDTKHLLEMAAVMKTLVLNIAAPQEAIKACL
ncbi:MAG: TetR/AcrR family transcriptional regulator [Pseudohongiellaceae bacterium]|nr:TetR/AcrR family transcriptional regulator [Pseudohongiellaceae bacterium]